MPALAPATPLSTALAERALIFPHESPFSKFNQRKRRKEMRSALALRADALADALTSHEPFEPPQTQIVQPCDAKVDLFLLDANPGCVRQLVFGAGACNACNPRADVFPRPGIMRPGIYLPGVSPTWDFWCPRCHRSAEDVPSKRERSGFEYGCPVHGPDDGGFLEMECEPRPHGQPPH